MIAFPSQLPLLRVGDLQLTEYNADWIASRLRSAALQLGKADWWIADDIARAVLSFLRSRYRESTVTVEYLAKKIRETLAKIGFGEIGEVLELAPPPINLDIADLAREAGQLPLFFFSLLKERISSLEASGVQEIRLVRSRVACMGLVSCKVWTKRSSLFHDELAAFVAKHAKQATINYI